jgi:hypothetical protein
LGVFCEQGNETSGRIKGGEFHDRDERLPTSQEEIYAMEFDSFPGVFLYFLRQAIDNQRDEPLANICG